MIKPLIRSLFIGLVLLVAVPVLLLSYSLFQVLDGFSGTYNGTTPVECGIVFGAAVHGNSRPGPAIERRINAGVSLYQAQRIERFIFTGGLGTGMQASEAEVMRDLAVSLGIPPDRIRIEPFSTSTWNNIRNIVPLLSDCDSYVGISDPYHLARIKLIGKKQGIDLATFPAEQNVQTTFLFQSILRETIGYSFYLIYP